MKHRIASILALIGATSCATSSHPTQPSKLGAAKLVAEMTALLDRPGPLEVETITSADWSVPKSGLINLEHAHARAAGLEDAEEPIQVYFHVVRHPLHGTFIIDTGVERALKDDPDHAVLSGMVASAAGVDKMKVRESLGEWLAARKEKLGGVFLTHLHLDHILGLPDVPRGTPIYAGPGETAPRKFENIVVQGVIDGELEGHDPLNEWGYSENKRVIDVFGDGSFWAMWLPGHTPGSTAYLARTEHGTVIFTGDVSHTVWGWDHDVEPGTFNGDAAQARDSFAALRALVLAHPGIEARLGHQARDDRARVVAAPKPETADR